MSELYLDSLCKIFGTRTILNDVNLTVASGTALSLLGPSGTGKSTLLSIASGLLAPDAGRVFLDGQDITPLPPEARNIGMVFQDAALFPHLSVAENVAFGLKMRGVACMEGLRQAHAMLERVELADKANQRPETLSGGEQQRAALARALITRPTVLLLDEPFARLDPRLRQDMRRLVQTLRKELGTTMLMVTHDGSEALTDGDTVAVLLDGKLVQTGTPQDLYEHPTSEAVARFFGEINVTERNGTSVFIRPDRLALIAKPADVIDDALDFGLVVKRDYAGSHVRLEMQSATQVWIVYAPPDMESGAQWNKGDMVALRCRVRHGD